VENSSALSKRGHNLFVAKDEFSLIDIKEPAVLQGFLEGSNVNAAEEMINLIELEKHFESMQKMVRSFDESFHLAAVEVGKY
jgi:flagellar basal-body rod protein FlgG